MKAKIFPLARPLRTAAPLRVPGDKSISHRALLFAALAQGESRIAGLAAGADVRSTARCLAQLGVPLVRGDGTPWMPAPASDLPAGAELEADTFVAPTRPPGASPLPERDPDMGPDDAIVLGEGARGLRTPVAPLDCGNSGTTMRLLAGILAGAGVEATLIGDHSLSGRPMERVAAPLRKLGARIDPSAGGKPPLRVHAGAPLSGAEIVSQVASAQMKSAVLLAGLFAQGETSFTEPAKSRDHTERLLRQMGAPLRAQGTRVSVNGPVALRPIALDVPGDLSSAAFLLAAALVAPAGSALELKHVGVNPTRAGFLDALAMFGARVQLKLGDSDGAGPADAGAFGQNSEPVARLSCSAQALRGAELDEALTLRAIDEVPILAVLGALAEGTTTIRGAGELRVKESDRLAVMAHGLRAMGASVEELPDGLRIVGVGESAGVRAAAGAPGGKAPRRLHGATIDAANDHRIALAFSVAALAADSPTLISGAEWADVSFPGFFSLLRSLGADVEIVP